MSRLVSWITEYSYRKAWIVLAVVVAVVGFGLYTITTVRQELRPGYRFPADHGRGRTPELPGDGPGHQHHRPA